MIPKNLLTEWSRLVLSSFVDAGIRDVVISPGARSAPFIIAASREPRLVRHSALDERAAAFFALGQARATGRPTLLVCTSGSAGAHYLPAIVEAGRAHVPLVVLTSDRPIELQGCAAAQTIDQTKMFGDHVRAFFDLGGPDAAPEALLGVRRIVAQATFSAEWPTPGAVHLNARARAPLEPVVARSAAEADLARDVTALLASPITAPYAPELAPSRRALAAVGGWCRDAERPLIVCGPASPEDAAPAATFELALALGAPVLCEATSQVRFAEAPRGVVVVDAFDTILRSSTVRRAARSDFVIQIGAPPTSTMWEPYVHELQAGSARAGNDGGPVRRVVVARHGWNDPTSSASALVLGDLDPALRSLARAAGGGRERSARWLARMDRANKAAWSIVDDELRGTCALSEGAVVRAVAEAIPRDSTLFIGNSLPVRQIDTFCKAGHTRATVLSQRGTNGIDGLVAGAAGAASVTDAPLTLLLGDISFLHDVSSLMLASSARAPLVIVVVNNAGGRIFEQLPLAQPPIEAAVLAHLTSPHALSFEHAALAYGVRYARAAARDELVTALEQAYSRGGCTVVEATVPPSGAQEQHRRIWDRADAVLAPLFAE